MTHGQRAGRVGGVEMMRCVVEKRVAFKKLAGKGIDVWTLDTDGRFSTSCNNSGATLCVCVCVWTHSTARLPFCTCTTC